MLRKLKLYDVLKQQELQGSCDLQPVDNYNLKTKKINKR